MAASRATVARPWHSGSVCADEREPHDGHLARRHRQARDAEAGEHEREQRVARGLAAHPDRAPGAPGALAGGGDDVEHGRLPRVEQVGQLALHAVGGHRVLREVVGAEAAEVDLGEHVRGPQGGARAPRS